MQCMRCGLLPQMWQLWAQPRRSKWVPRFLSLRSTFPEGNVKWWSLCIETSFICRPIMYNASLFPDLKWIPEIELYIYLVLISIVLTSIYHLLISRPKKVLRDRDWTWTVLQCEYNMVETSSHRFGRRPHRMSCRYWRLLDPCRCVP